MHSWWLNLTTMADNLILRIFKKIGKANHKCKTNKMLNLKQETTASYYHPLEIRNQLILFCKLNEYFEKKDD